MTLDLARLGRARQLVESGRELGHPACHGLASVALCAHSLAHAIARRPLLGLGREQIERHLAVVLRHAAALPQLSLELVECALGRFGLGLRAALRAAHLGEPLGGLALAGRDFRQPLGKPRRLGGRLVGALQHSGGALAQEHDLVLGLGACVLAVAQPRLRRGQLALEFQQRQLLIVDGGFEPVHCGGDALAPHRLLLPLLAQLVLALLQLADASGRELQVERPDLVAQPLIAARLADLTRERAQLALDLEHDVVETGEIAFGGVELVERLLLALLVLGDARRLLEQEPAMTRVVRQDVVDHRTLDHRVGVAAHARVEEQVADVAQPTRGLIEEVLAHSRAEHPPGDRDLAVFGGQQPAIVLEREVDFGQAERLATRAAVEDHVFHRITAQGLGTLLAENPADGVGDVGLATAVRTDHPGDTVTEEQLGLVDERFEALDVELVEKHG